MNLRDAKAGDVVSFDYKGDNDVVSRKRLAEITLQEWNGALTKDLEDGYSIKRFNHDRAKNVVVVELKDSVSSTDNFDSVTFDSKLRKFIVVPKSHVPGVKFSVLPANAGVLTEWKNKDGKVLTLDFTNKVNGVVPVVNLVTKLANHYGVVTK